MKYNQIRKAPPQKKTPQNIHFAGKSRKAAEHQAWVREWAFCWIFGLIRICSLLISWSKQIKSSNNLPKTIQYISLQIPILKVICRQSVGHRKILDGNLYLSSGPNIFLNLWFHLCCAFVYLVVLFIFCVFCWSSTCFFVSFLNIIELRLDFGHLKISFSESDLKIWEKIWSGCLLLVANNTPKKDVKNHTEEANSLSILKIKILIFITKLKHAKK